MRIVLRSFGLAALGAIAITVFAAQGPQQTRPCATTKDATSGHCAFEQLLWDLVRDSADHTELEAYIRMYPEGRFVAEAKRQLGMLAPRQRVAAPRPTRA